MKSMYCLKKIIAFNLLVFIFAANIIAQDRWSMKIDYSRMDDWGMFSGNIGDFKIMTDYELKKYLETGVYIGYAATQVREAHGSGYYGANVPVISYGVYANFYPLNLILNRNFRYNPYISVKTGGFYIFPDSDYTDPSGSGIVFCPGIGFSYYIFKKIGIFGEYVYGIGEGKYRYRKDFYSGDWKPDDVFSFRVGLSFKFN